MGGIQLQKGRKVQLAMPKPRKKPLVVPTTEQVEQLLRSFSRAPTSVRNRALVALMWRCGLRVSEALALLPGDVDAERGVVVVRRGKGGRSRTVGIDAGALALVDAWLRDPGGDIGRARYLGSEVDGGYAEYVAVPAVNAHRIEVDLSDVELASFPCSYATAEHMLHRAGTSTKEAEGIVLIDEIGTNLHPGWKKRIVSCFRDVFPKIQFIVTTHEPLCLRGLHEGETVLLRRGDENRIIPITNMPNPNDLRVDELLASEFFGLSSTIESDLEDIYEEYYRLLTKTRSRPVSSVRLRTPSAAKPRSISINRIPLPKPISTWPMACMTRRPT